MPTKSHLNRLPTFGTHTLRCIKLRINIDKLCISKNLQPS